MQAHFLPNLIHQEMRGVSGRDDCAIKIRHLHGSTDISNTHRCAERAILRTGVEFFAVGAQIGRFCAREWNFLQLVRRKGDSAHGRGGEWREVGGKWRGVEEVEEGAG